MWFDRGVDPDAVRLAIGFASIAAVVWSILAVVAHVGVLDPEILAFQPFLVLHLVFGLGVIRAVAPRTS